MTAARLPMAWRRSTPFFCVVFFFVCVFFVVVVGGGGGGCVFLIFFCFFFCSFFFSFFFCVFFFCCNAMFRARTVNRANVEQLTVKKFTPPIKTTQARWHVSQLIKTLFRFAQQTRHRSGRALIRRLFDQVVRNYLLLIVIGVVRKRRIPPSGF